MKNAVYGIFILLALTFSGSAAAADEFVSSGTVYYNNAVWGTYGIYNGAQGPWMRIWHNGTQVLTAGFNQSSDGWVSMSWMDYQTSGYHWTLRGGKDTTDYWNLKNAGLFAFPMSTPAALSAFLTSGGAGQMRTTHYAQGPRFQYKYYPIQDSWKPIYFAPSSVNSAAVSRLVATVGGSGVVTASRPANSNNNSRATTRNNGGGVNILGISSGTVR